MMPVGYMAKYVCSKPESLKAARVKNIFSVSGCMSTNFTDYKHVDYYNGLWFFNSPEEIRDLAVERFIKIRGTLLFYYEAYEVEFDGSRWVPYSPDPTLLPVSAIRPRSMQFAGFDVVTFSADYGPECSPLSCNSLAELVSANEHCLLASFDEAEQRIADGSLRLPTEPGPFRIFAVYSVDRGQ
jgi:hypothetical protein